MVYTCVPWSPLELTHKIRFNGCFVVEKMPIAVMVNSLFLVAQESQGDARNVQKKISVRNPIVAYPSHVFVK